MRAEKRHRSTTTALIWLGLATCCVGVLALAAWLEPDARGYGTHAQLGLPPCGFRWLTGFACPGCGLTTAFAHAIRADWSLAFSANPLGVVLFAIVCGFIPLAVVAAVRGWSFGAAFDRLQFGRWSLAVAGCAAVVWLARIAEAI